MPKCFILNFIIGTWVMLVALQGSYYDYEPRDEEDNKNTNKAAWLISFAFGLLWAVIWALLS